MKSTTDKNQRSSAPLLTFLLVLSLLILISLIMIIGLIARDSILPAIASSRTNGFPSEQVISSSEIPTTVLDPTATPTPFQPLPTNTRTLTPSPTTEPTVTWTPSPTTTLPPPPPPPENPLPPESAKIENINGYAQTLTLDCESRSAVDWAAYFGVQIGEFEFLNSLPRSDDPNQGFVGDPGGFPGQTPPYSYGVHASPVARLLRAFGLPAEEVYGLDIEILKSEIASGDPVIAWVTVGTQRGYAVEYITTAGETIDVTPYEHTVIVIGYDPGGVTILDGAMVYWRDWNLFQDSFGLLGNMAIIFNPN